MIGIISENNILKDAIIEILKDFKAESYQEDHTYRLIIIQGSLLPKNFKPSVPVMSLGPCNQKGVITIPLPISPQQLIQKAEKFCLKDSSKPTFENQAFLFYKSQRCLKLKDENVPIPLTEKENALLTCLADNFPNTVNKEQLLTLVWNYHQDAITHTIESHIHTLRQKLGTNADRLIKNTPDGYSLIE